MSLLVTKVYLMRWRIEEYFKFKKQQFDFEDIRVWSLKSIRNFNLITTITVGYIGIMIAEKPNSMFFIELKKCSKRIYDIPKFIYYAIGYAIESILVKTKVGIQSFIPNIYKSQQYDIYTLNWQLHDFLVSNFGETQTNKPEIVSSCFHILTNQYILESQRCKEFFKCVLMMIIQYPLK